METMESSVSEIDPIAVKLRKTSPKVTGGILRVRESALAAGVFPTKVKVLTALSLSVAIRCEPCIGMYVDRAIEEGATYEEIVEFLNLAMVMQGCPGEAWALKALEIYERLAARRSERKPGDEGHSCCPDRWFPEGTEPQPVRNERAVQRRKRP